MSQSSGFYIGAPIVLGGGTGTVTSVSVPTVNGVGGTVANDTTTPAITITLGAIIPTSVTSSGAVSGTNISASGTILSSSPTAGIGYTTGAGGTVTQLTSRTTGVTLNKLSGQITTHNASLASGAEAAFLVTNSTVVATDVIALSIASGGVSGDTKVSVNQVSAGSFQILVANLAGGVAETGSIVINYAVLRGSAT